MNSPTPPSAAIAEELKPCPFCGQEPQTIGIGNYRAVRCLTCAKPQSITDGWISILRWNTRAEDSRVRPLVEALDDVTDSLTYFQNSEFWKHEHAHSLERARNTLSAVSSPGKNISTKGGDETLPAHAPTTTVATTSLVRSTEAGSKSAGTVQPAPSAENAETPECDAQCDKDQHDARQWYDFARTLERQRNAARAERDALKKSLLQLRREMHEVWVSRDRIEEELARVKAERDAMQRVITEVWSDTEGYADGAPDATAHDKLANQVSGKLADYRIKP